MELLYWCRLLRLTSSTLVCLLLPHVGAQDSVGEFTSAIAEVQSVDGLAPHPDPVSTCLRMNALRAMTLSLRLDNWGQGCGHTLTILKPEYLTLCELSRNLVTWTTWKSLHSAINARNSCIKSILVKYISAENNIRQLLYRPEWFFVVKISNLTYLRYPSFSKQKSYKSIC